MASPAPVNVAQTNYTQQLEQTYKGLEKTAPGFFNLNNTYSPLYTNLNLRTLDQTLFGDGTTPGQLSLMRGAQTYSREGDIADIERLGPEGYRALMAANPGLAASLNNANQQGAEVFAPGSLMSTLEDTARGQLALGGELSPQEQTAQTQADRAGFADRGMTMGNQSLGAELLGRDNAMQARLGQRLGWAQGVEGAAGQDRNQLTNLAQLNAGIYDPSTQVLGRGSSSLAGLLGGGGVNPLSLMGSVNTQTLFNPQQGADAFNTNVNAQGAAAISNSNNAAARTNGLIGAGATILGSVAVAL